jgi:hypothetical protein
VRGCGVPPAVSVAGTHRTAFTQTGTHVVALLAGAATASRVGLENTYFCCVTKLRSGADTPMVLLVWAIKLKLENSELWRNNP